ncbi:MAG: Gfo/Idh/MocA family oxidoreductase [Verrucomicrobia bacterium]|nr:Gfo/Idh/MocA family oxidoreductase [Verrucomicrobiota bacterium]
MSASVRWGILGAGQIARKFAAALKQTPGAELVAVGSRSSERAESFGQQCGAPNRYASYAELVNDPQVDVVYVATRHSSHKENAQLALSAGKAVLCEKPFAVNTRQAEEVMELARLNKLFLMEAMWTRFFPLMVRLREMLQEKVIGEPRMLMADFGFRAEFDPASRLFNPIDGGGALLDVGIYPISLASMIFGSPTKITGLARLGKTGVDEESAVLLQHAGGELAMIGCAVRTNMPQEALIMGSAGQIRIHSPWWRPKSMSLVIDQSHHRVQREKQFRLNLPFARPITLNVSAGVGSEKTLDFPFEGNGYCYEAAEVMRCLREGKLESPTMPLHETLSILRTLDAIRAQWGLRYPVE